MSLGVIPSGSSGSKDFGKVGTLSLPAGYEITFTLDTSIAQDFDSLSVYIYIYREGVYVSHTSLSLSWPSDSVTLDAGTYDIHVRVEYKAKSVTTTRTGKIVVSLSWPG